MGDSDDADRGRRSRGVVPASRVRLESAARRTLADAAAQAYAHARAMSCFKDRTGALRRGIPRGERGQTQFRGPAPRKRMHELHGDKSVAFGDVSSHSPFGARMKSTRLL